MSAKVHTIVPPTRSSSREGTAFPPLEGVPDSTAWRDMRHHRAKLPLWRRLLGRGA